MNTPPYEIILEDETPVVCKPFPRSAGERTKARELLHDLETAGVIRKSNSKYCANAFLKIKPSGKPHLLINYKPLNDKIASNHNSTARTEVLFESVQKAKMYSVLDLMSGYYQIRLLQKILVILLPSNSTPVL